MSRFSMMIASLAVFTIAVGLTGCPAEEEPAPPTETTEEAAGGEEASATTVDEHAGHEHAEGEAEHAEGEAEHAEGEAEHAEGETAHAEGEAEHAHGSPETTEAFAALSPEDHAAAEKQGTCPVSGGALGSMGTPIKVTVKDRDVFICCSGCEEKLKADPDTYLAKLGD